MFWDFSLLFLNQYLSNTVWGKLETLLLIRNLKAFQSTCKTMKLAALLSKARDASMLVLNKSAQGRKRLINKLFKTDKTPQGQDWNKKYFLISILTIQEIKQEGRAVMKDNKTLGGKNEQTNTLKTLMKCCWVAWKCLGYSWGFRPRRIFYKLAERVIETSQFSCPSCAGICQEPSC